MQAQVEELYFPVEMMGLGDIAPGYIGKNNRTHVVVGKIGDENRVLNVCSERYTLVPNQELLPPIFGVLDNMGLDYSVNARHHEYEKFYVDIKINDHQVEVGKGDPIFPKIEIMHSYSGSMNFRIMFGWYRLVCSNGLTIIADEKKDEFIQIGGKHTPKLNRLLPEFQDKVGLYLGKHLEYAQRFQVLTDRTVPNYAERLEEVIAGVGGRLPLKIKEPAIDTVASEMDMLNLRVANDWLVYNAINTQLFDDRTNIIHNEIRKDIDAKVLNYIVHRPMVLN